MSYQRPTVARPEPHKIYQEFKIYGQLQDDLPSWVAVHANDLLDNGRFYLGHLQKAVNEAKEMEFPELKEEVAAQKRAEHVLKARRALLQAIRPHIEATKQSAEASTQAILRVTEPEVPKDPSKAMLQELRNQEIRTLVRNMVGPDDKKAFVRNNLERLQAVISSPDKLLDEKVLLELRREFALKQDPTRADEEKDSRRIYNEVRRKAAEINATSLEILRRAGLEDPLPLPEFFETFPAEGTKHEVSAAGRILREWHRREAAKKQLREQEAAGEGLKRARNK
jgi:hypothetical protein